MRLLNLFNKPHLDNVELAYQLLLVDCAEDPKYKNEVTKILNSLPKDEYGNWDRELWLKKVIALADTPNTPKQRYILSTAYYYLGAKYRKEAIKYLSMYIEGGIWDGLFLYAPTHTLYDYKEQTLANTIYWLADCYEKEYDFDLALSCYEKMIEILPNYPSGYIGKAHVLIKQNNSKKCLDWLNSIKNSSLYKKYYYKDSLNNTFEDNEFMLSIDKLLKETEDKIKKGYVYKPRKK